MGILSNLFNGADKINDYFMDAVRVYAFPLDPTIRIAGLSSARLPLGAESING